MKTKVPSLAGVASMTDAMQPGLSVEECVRRLKRYHYAFKRLHQIFTSRITAEPLYELKMAFSLHAHLCAEHVAALRKRVGEMREPPLGLEAVPDPSLELFFDEVLAAPSTEELVLGLYESALPALQGSLQRHLEDTNPLADYPSVRICRFALLELRDMLRFGVETVSALVPEDHRIQLKEWLGLLADALAAAGDLDGTQPAANLSIKRHHSAGPFRYDKVPKRDHRFPDPFNMAINAEIFLYDEKFPQQPKRLMMYYNQLREIDVSAM